MVNNLLRQNSSQSARADGDTVDALVDMLRRNGIDPGRINALINKASYPPTPSATEGSNSNRPARKRAS